MLLQSLFVAVFFIRLALGAPPSQYGKRAVVDQLTGFALLNGGTTGGAGGATVTVSSLAALRTAVAGDTARIVKVSGLIQGDEGQIEVGSNKSILGLCGAEVTGSGFRIRNRRNVIIRNLKISKAFDLIQIDLSTNVWVDHNELYSDLDHDKDYYDHAIDILRGSQYLTISWNYIHTQRKMSIIGNSDSETLTWMYTVTYHHNWISDLEIQVPSTRHTLLHAYNNYFKDISSSAISLRLSSHGVIQYNKFENVQNPLTCDDTSTVVVVGNDWIIPTPIPYNLGGVATVPYSYGMDPVASVAAIVTTSAGICKITV